MDTSPCYDLIVIGGGLIGSACVRHACDQGATAVLVGPQEPLDRADTETHGCWHDEGRLYTLRDVPGVWGHLACASIPRFPALEAASGIKMHQTSGYLGVSGPRYTGFQDWMKASKDYEKKGKAKVCDSQTLPSDLATFFSLPSESVACWEAGGGHLSPRAFVAAQLSLARRAGAKLVPSLATGLSKNGDNWEVTTETGERVLGKRVVLAQGTYTAINSLLDPLLPPFDLTLTAQTTALLEVDKEQADRLSAMPSMVIHLEPSRYTYILPPILYPNGRHYLKFGAHDLSRELRTKEDVVNHYRIGPNPDHVRKLACEARVLIPSLSIISVEGDSCVTSNTPGKIAPFIDTLDMVGKGLVLAAGGCGHAAKGADEIGRLGSVLALHERWDSDLPKDLFRVRFKTVPRL